MYEDKELLDVVEISEVKEEGITCPIVCRLQNGIQAVVKYMYNRFGMSVLINEWIGGNIASKLGLTIPEFGLCSISEEVILNFEENDEIDANNAGIGFYSVIIPNSVPVNYGMLSLVSNKLAEKMYLFDYIVNNHDRHNGNLLIDLSGDVRMVCIDNSHILFSCLPYANESWETKLTKICEVDSFYEEYNSDFYKMVRNACGFDIAKFKMEVNDAKDTLNEAVFDSIISEIPSEWIKDENSLDCISRALKFRLDHIDDLVELIERNG